MHVTKGLFTCFSFTLFSVCFLFVGWQSWKCFSKYLEQPQSTKLSIEKLTSQDIYPTITICPFEFLEEKKQRDSVKKCGIEPQNYAQHGDWMGNCSDPKVLFESLVYPIEELINEIYFLHGNGSDYHFAPKDLEWTHSGSLLKGRCYHLEIPEEMDVSEVDLESTRDFLVYIHSPYNFRTTEAKESFEVVKDKTTKTEVKVELYNMLDYLGQKCNTNASFNFDECLATTIDSECRRRFGCSTPFGMDLEHICRSSEQGGQSAYDLYNHNVWTSYRGNTCSYPCSYLSVTVAKQSREQSKGIAKVEFYFPDKVTVMTSQYSYNELTLIAEIGGYVGLFLGVSVIQISGAVKCMVSKIVKSYSFGKGQQC